MSKKVQAPAVSVQDQLRVLITGDSSIQGLISQCIVGHVSKLLTESPEACEGILSTALESPNIREMIMRLLAEEQNELKVSLIISSLSIILRKANISQIGTGNRNICIEGSDAIQL